eukprot:GEMP01025894.1.p1 GENE.GEMP01025894.1~~GEMP01025894.1.p1  ORF type:complete len:384 (+),score=57.52 GEMP01025894.1:163-1314(+)
MLWMCISVAVVLALPHVVRIGPVENPSLSVRFGPQSVPYDCEVKSPKLETHKLAVKSRWALLSRHCKAFTMDRWNYHLCFSGSLLRFQHGGHARISLGFYDDRLDTYTDDYLVQHYINGSRIPDSDKQNRTSEVRCFCGTDEPRIQSIEYGNHTIVKVEMPSCCRKVELSSVINALPRSLFFEAKIGHRDVRFPSTHVTSVKVEFKNKRLVLDHSSNEQFGMGEPKFIANIPNIALGPLVPRATLRPNVRPALYFPLTRHRKTFASGIFDDDDDYGYRTRSGMAFAAIADEKNASASAATDADATKVAGGVFCTCHDNWSTTMGEEMVNLVQVQYLPGITSEVYVILESLAFCAFHQLLPQYIQPSAIQCRPNNPTTTFREKF